MSGEFDSRKYSHLTIFERRPRILVKLSYLSKHLVSFCDSSNSLTNPEIMNINSSGHPDLIFLNNACKTKINEGSLTLTLM